MSNRAAAITAELSNYAFISIPLPVMHDPAVSRVDAAVLGAFYSRSRLNVHCGAEPRVQLSLRQIATLAATDKRSAARSRDRLVELGYLERVSSGRSTALQRGTSAFVPRLPERARDARFLLAGVRDGVEVDDSEGGGGATHRGVGEVPTGGGDTTHRGVGEVPTLRDPRDPEEDPGDERAAPEPRERGDDAAVEEVEEPLLDDGSAHASGIIERERERRREEARRPRRRVLAVDERLLREPSRRPELNRWREKVPGGDRGWSARDLVGYFVCRFRETRGEESTEFFATTEKIYSHHASNVSKYVRRWLEGDYRRAVVLCDRILERAEDLGMPVKLGYFFTPATEGTARRLEEQRRGRPATPAERNDRAGADTPENQARIERLRREFIEEERNGAKSEVRRDDRGAA